ncbi:MAG: glutamate-5-semialdehyde dehydrogenase [Lentisphaeria bacterium]|nr:glutamate-5-semialdehyde dehydrogenase [Lentisphaeria bacterium]
MNDPQEITREKNLRNLEEQCRKARKSALLLGCASSEEKNRWLSAMADALEENMGSILFANASDMEKGRAKGLSSAMLDRLRLDEKRIRAMADALRHVVTLPDPVGEELSSYRREDGLLIRKVSVPIGVIGFIYESRPNVTSDAASLCLKSGNAVILRGGSEAFASNCAIADAIIAAAEKAGMPEGALSLIRDTSHETVNALLKMDRYVNLIIPRGGEKLIRTVVKESTIPVIKHYKGVCHLFVDKDADIPMALSILENGKFQRPGVCNALETVLIHEEIAEKFVPEMKKLFAEKGLKKVYGDEKYCKLDENAEPVPEENYSNEYLDTKISAKIVSSVEEAVEHINFYGSGHSDSIVTKDSSAAEYFQNYVDSATVYWNASTRFTDGGEFGMGAEIGISTDKLHARGPMGLKELTTYKYKIYGSGQIRK